MDNIEKHMWVQSLWGPLEEQSKSPMFSNKEGLRVAAYARVSPGIKDDSKSLNNQVHYFTLKIKENPKWKFVGIYLDDNISGMSYKNRPGLKRLLRHASEGKVEVVLIKDISRFSRNFQETLELVKEFKSLGVTLCFEREGIDTSQENALFALKIYSSMAQEESAVISNSTKWAYEKMFMKGNPRYSKTFGYDLVKVDGKKTLSINKEEAKVVEYIYEMYLKGVSQADIARQIVARGIKTPKGKDIWGYSTVKGILNNVTYIGSKLTRMQSRELLTNKKSIGTRDQYLIENCHPAIISKEDFEKARNISSSKAKIKKPFKKGPLSSLKGRLYCGRCGQSISRKEKTHEYVWKCRSADVKLCDLKHSKESKIKEMMLKAYGMRYELNSNNIVKIIKTEITRINENDHFEFHRLKYLTDIEILRKTEGSEIQLQNLVLEYKIFEEKIIKIEDDRKYRNITLEFLDSIKIDKEFIERIEIDHMRALISGMTIYSEEDYIVHWFDGKDTVIGDYKKYGKQKLMIEEIELYQPKDIDSKIEIILNPINQKVEVDESAEKEKKDKLKIEISSTENKKEVDELESNTQLEVIPIEAGRAAITMKNIYEGLETFNQIKIPNVIKKRKTRVAAYCRVSTDSTEQELSLKTQIAFYTYLILSNPNYEFVGIYADEGISGRQMDNRVELLKLLDECRKDKVDLILTKSISRFSRNIVNILEMVNELKNLPNPTYIFFEKENLRTDSKESSLIISLHGAIAEEEVRSNGEATAWGKRRSVENGIVPVHYNYGYIKNDDGSWQINEEEAQVVRRIYEEAIAGKLVFRIAKDLGIDGIKSPLGKDYWYDGPVMSILKNEVYKGAYLYQKTFVKNSLKSVPVKNDGEMPQFYIENHHKAIIEPSIWEEVQEVLAQNPKRKKYNDRHLDTEMTNKSLENIFTCGKCGSKLGHELSIERRTKEVKYQHYWMCISRRNYYKIDRCDLLILKQRYLEWNLLRTFLDVKVKPKFKEKFKINISKMQLTEDEIKKENAIKEEMEFNNMELYKAVDTELNINGQDTTLINQLTEKIVSLKDELKEYEDRRENIISYQNQWDSLQKDLVYLNEDKYNRFEENRDVETLEFLNKMVKAYISKGEITQEGTIRYEFNMGISWGIKMCYDYYKNKIEEERIKARKEKYEKLLNTEEVDKLIRFCKTPRKYSEAYAFMNELQKMSEHHFRKRYLNPLVEKGRLEKKIKEKISSKNQRYFSVIETDE